MIFINYKFNIKYKFILDITKNFDNIKNDWNRGFHGWPHIGQRPDIKARPSRQFLTLLFRRLMQKNCFIGEKTQEYFNVYFLFFYFKLFALNLYTGLGKIVFKSFIIKYFLPFLKFKVLQIYLINIFKKLFYKVFLNFFINY